jgi:hypothetical protein
MALLLPCQNEISAHLLRSLLLSHGIPSHVVHDNFSTLYGNCFTRPHILISEEALDNGLELLAVPDEPIDESFVEPLKTTETSEDLGLRRTTPSQLAPISAGFCTGFLLGLVAVFFWTFMAITYTTNWAQAVTLLGWEILSLPLWWGICGLFIGFICWPFPVFARSCRHRDDGSLPLRARLILLFCCFFVGATY